MGSCKGTFTNCPLINHTLKSWQCITLSHRYLKVRQIEGLHTHECLLYRLIWMCHENFFTYFISMEQCTYQNCFSGLSNGKGKRIVQYLNVIVSPSLIDAFKLGRKLYLSLLIKAILISNHILYAILTVYTVIFPVAFLLSRI